MPNVQIEPLYQLFSEIFDGLNVEQDVIDELFNDIREAYSEDGRFYHTLDHLYDLAAEFEKHRETFGGDTRAVLIALFYHDIVYNCVPEQDEQDSAEEMTAALEDYIDEDTLEKAAMIILYTASHQAPEHDKAARLFLDMDMSILGATPDRYAQYLHNVTQEYCSTYGISVEAFQQKRAELFLMPTIENGRKIFTTDEYASIEAQAHSNITWELNRNSESAFTAPQP